MKKFYHTIYKQSDFYVDTHKKLELIIDDQNKIELQNTTLTKTISHLLKTYDEYTTKVSNNLK